MGARLDGVGRRTSEPDAQLADNRTDPGEQIPCGVLFFGVFVFIAAEVAAFVAVAGQVGFLWAFAMLILASALGPLIVRRVGFSVLGHIRARLEQGEVPTRELLDGLVVLIGGVMICVPGFVGDAIGLTLMVGPVRHLIIRRSGHRLAGRVQNMHTDRWRVIDARARRSNDGSPPAQGPPSGALGPGSSG